MTSTAFITPASCAALSSSLRANSFVSSRVTGIPRRYATRRARVSMETENTSPPQDTKPMNDTSTVGAPSFDTEVFSNFVDSAQGKIDEFQQQLQDIDTDQVVADAKETSVGLVDNLIAGDWLNRGELYGAIQLVFVLLLLRGPGFLDGLVSFVSGPVLLSIGAVISGKAVWDLGRRQLSIWPAPVPNAELRTDGLYSYVRHPIYSGLILASTGFALSTGSPARLALTIAMAAFLSKKMDVEETYLRDAYPDYESYADSVPFKIIPKIF